jgi:hypothetical protein
MRLTARCISLEHRIDEDILEEIKLYPFGEKPAECERKYLNYVSRMEEIRNQKQLLDYRPI